jgi:hypothetical protein
MGWRFRRSIKIAPGIRWNLSKRGTSWSFGRRGFTVNVSSRGVRRTVSIPGTGLSHTSFTKRRKIPAAVNVHHACDRASPSSSHPGARS